MRRSVGRAGWWTASSPGTPASGGAAHSLLARISPVLHYYSLSPLSGSGHRERDLPDSHDSLTDWYEHRRTPGQLRACVGSLGATAVWCEPGGIGVELRARRPAE